MIFGRRKKKQAEEQAQQLEQAAQAKQQTAKPQKLGLIGGFWHFIHRIIRLLKITALILPLLLVLAIYLIFTGQPEDFSTKDTITAAGELDSKILASQNIELGDSYSLEISSDEATSFVESQIINQNMPLDQVQIAFSKNRVKFTGVLEKALGGLKVTFLATFTPQVQNGKVALVPKSLKLGRLPLPASLLESYTDKINQNINKYLEGSETTLSIEKIKAEKDKLTVEVKAEP